ncbi:MAG: 50S ribosomal protein L32 [Actinobacteria bacterium]|nr:50S ribosomal protein L32 [Actinomycetota bacterium]MDP9021923.1 50S ribosomal protein L32 [Actinomycetota bacterium]
MAVPKRKLSRSRTRHRKSNWLRLAKPTYATCKRCKSPIRPHTVCRVCGSYGGQQVIEPESY